MSSLTNNDNINIDLLWRNKTMRIFVGTVIVDIKNNQICLREKFGELFVDGIAYCRITNCISTDNEEMQCIDCFACKSELDVFEVTVKNDIITLPEYWINQYDLKSSKNVFVVGMGKFIRIMPKKEKITITDDEIEKIIKLSEL